MLKRMLGLPGYFGGKRRIVPHIFRYLPKPTRDRPLTFLDPFMGGGSVSYYAKFMGYKVIAGDIAFRSEVIGRAVIENNRRKLPPWQIFLEESDNTWLWDHYREYFPTDDFVKLFDIVRGNVRKRGDRPLELFFYLKMLLYIVPFNLLIYKRPELKGDEAEKLRQLSKHRLWAKFKKYLANPYAFVRRNWEHVNKLIYDNGQKNEFYREDAIKLIARTDAEILYMDPPYPGTIGYDELLWADRMLLEDENYTEAQGEEWTNPETFPEVFRKALEAAKYIPNLVISIGNYDHNKLLEWVREYRPKARMFSIKYNWLYALKKKERGDELLIIDLARWYE